MPYGAYDRFSMSSALSDAGQQTPIAVEAAAGDKFVFSVMEPIVVFGFRLLCTTAINYDTMTTAAKVALDKRPVYGADDNRSQLGIVTIPQGLAAGKFLNRKITPTKMLPGEQLVFEVTVQGAGGTETGEWLPVIVCAPVPETDGNCANIVQSA